MTEDTNRAERLLVNEREARALLGGLCAKTMYTLRRQGLLKSVKVGARTMYRPDDLRDFARRGSGKSPVDPDAPTR